MFKYSLILLLFLCVSSCSQNTGIPRGELAPEIELTDLEGLSQSLTKHKGKIVMLYFWAASCPTCKKEFPETEKYYKKLKGEDFELLAINVGEQNQEESSKKYKEDFDITFPMLNDSDGKYTKMYAIDALPTNYFISPEGKVIRRILGWVDENQVQVMINQNL
jgi:peroxiredoxin